MHREFKIAYAAGILDGEAWVGWDKNNGVFVPSIEVTMTDKAPLELLYELFGGSIYECKRTKPHHKIAWRWRTRGPKAEKALSEMGPYLRVKSLPALDTN